MGRKLCFIFFFQAEDGIRDTSVTGVQTCALPISLPQGSVGFSIDGQRVVIVAEHLETDCQAAVTPETGPQRRPLPRSEERRVGKECRAQGKSYHEKKQQKRKCELNAADDMRMTEW